ncbi:hypothetical protein BaRGS_00024393 [Batillaria attramentaria]|uniref:Uncharacterized protein n=1 Tax=Batillaria attramentaria TaxID=370345 RepID=A0ABD0KBB6_9CAEN
MGGQFSDRPSETTLCPDVTAQAGHPRTGTRWTVVNDGDAGDDKPGAPKQQPRDPLEMIRFDKDDCPRKTNYARDGMATSPTDGQVHCPKGQKIGIHINPDKTVSNRPVLVLHIHVLQEWTLIVVGR